MVDETSAVAGPVEFGGALEVGSWLAAQHGRRPDADVGLLETVGPPRPERDEGPVR